MSLATCMPPPAVFFGPGSSLDNQLARWNGTEGNTLKVAPLTYIGDNGHMSLGKVSAPRSMFELWDNDAHPILSITAAHATDYDPQLQLCTDATDTVKCSLGVDSGDSDKFKIYMGEGIGGTSQFVIDAAGNIGFGTDAPDSLLTLCQPGDEDGIKVFGYDDKSSEWVKLNVDSVGYGGLYASDRTIIAGRDSFDVERGFIFNWSSTDGGENAWVDVDTIGGVSRLNWSADFKLGDSKGFFFGTGNDYNVKYFSGPSYLRLQSTDIDGIGTNGIIWSVYDGTDDFIIPTGSIGIGTTTPETLLELASTAPYITLHNSTEEDGDGGRESKLLFKGEQSGGEETTLASIMVAHDGAADDQKGYIAWATNDGTDDDAPTERLRIDSAGLMTYPGASVYQNTTNSTTAYQWLDADGGTPVLNIDTTNERVGIGTASPVTDFELAGIFAISIASGDPRMYFDIGGTPKWYVGVDDSANDNFKISVNDHLRGARLSVREINGDALLGINVDPVSGAFSIKEPNSPGSNTKFNFIKPSNNDALNFQLSEAGNSSFTIRYQWSGQDYNIFQVENIDANPQVQFEDTTQVYFQVGSAGYSYLRGGNLGLGETAPETLLELTSTVPYITLHNSTEEDGDGGRESILWFSGEQSGGEETHLASMTVAHDGSSDDQKGYIAWGLNSGAEGDSPTERMRLDSGLLGITTDVVFDGAGSGLPYGCMSGIDETITCTDQNTYYQVTFDTVGPSNLTTVSIANEEITVLKAGVYYIAVTACFHSGVSHDFELLVKKNDGATALEPHLFQTTAVANQVENTAGSCIVTLSAGDRVELFVRCTDAAGQNAIFDHASLTCSMIGG